MSEQVFETNTTSTNDIKYDHTHFCQSWATCCEENLSRKPVNPVCVSGPSKSQMLSEMGEDPNEVVPSVHRPIIQSKSQMLSEMG